MALDDQLLHRLSRCAHGVDHPSLHLFGGMYVTWNGRRQEVPEGSKRLLAFVALRRGRVERQCAAGALWPTSDDRRAAGNLRSALWRLRGAGIDVLSADKWSLVLNGDVIVDVHVVDEWATRLIEGTTRGDDLGVSLNWLEALDLLPGWYEDWALIERERMRQRALHALEALSRCLSRAGRFAAAVEAAILVVNADPLRESAQRALIEAHLAEGNLVEARRGYQVYRDLINRELGVEPSPDLLALLLTRPVLVGQRGSRTSRARVSVAPGRPQAERLARVEPTATS